MNKNNFNMLHIHIPSHFSKEMDKMQGGRIRDSETGYPTYDRLNRLVKHPGIQFSLKSSLQRHAEGGRAEFDKLAHKGRFGDSEIALVPKPFLRHLDDIYGPHTINPHTKFPEYFVGTLSSRPSFDDGGIVGNVIDQALPFEPFRDFVTPLVQAGKQMKETIETGQNRARASEKATQAKYGMMLMNKLKKEPGGLFMGLLRHDMPSTLPTLPGLMPQNASMPNSIPKNGHLNQKQKAFQMMNPQQPEPSPQNSPQVQMPPMNTYKDEDQSALMNNYYPPQFDQEPKYGNYYSQNYNPYNQEYNNNY